MEITVYTISKSLVEDLAARERGLQAQLEPYLEEKERLERRHDAAELELAQLPMNPIEDTERAGRRAAALEAELDIIERRLTILKREMEPTKEAYEQAAARWRKAVKVLSEWESYQQAARAEINRYRKKNNMAPLGDDVLVALPDRGEGPAEMTVQV